MLFWRDHSVTFAFRAQYLQIRTMDIAHLRKEYTKDGLSEEAMPGEPLNLFKLWFDQAIAAQILEPNAMSLATVAADNMPNMRTVLLKFYDAAGFVFFTNYTSQKAQELSANPHASILFPWLALERQVKIQGTVERIANRESLKYFMTRPFGSQLGAWVSHQSQVISSRKILEMKLAEMKQKFADGKVPLPSFWGGYRLVPRNYEFWQGRANRLHDRIAYTRHAADPSAWQINRLAP